MQSHITIPVGSDFITGELFKPEGKVTATMLICHGWTSSNKKYLPLAESLSKVGLLVLAINLRGMGDSVYRLKKYSRQDHLNDLISAIDYMKSISSSPLIVMGKSYGGYLSAIASSQRTIDYLIISQPALYPDSGFTSSNDTLIKENPNIYRSSDEKVESNRALNSIFNFNKPLLIIESEHDKEVLDIPKLYIRASEDNTKRSVIVLNGADHPLTRPEWRKDYFFQIATWLKNTGLLR